MFDWFTIGLWVDFVSWVQGMALETVDKFSCVTTFFSLKMRLSTPFWIKVHIPQHYYGWDILLPWLWCPAFLYVTWTAQKCFLYLLEQGSNGLVSVSADSRESCVLLHLELGWTIWAQCCASLMSPCEAEHYCHSALPLLSCPLECFDRTIGRDHWGFLKTESD